MKFIRNLLVIGGCILIWLVLIGMAGSAIYVGSQSDGSSSSDTPSMTRTTDQGGYSCYEYQVSSGGLCPGNAGYGD